MIAVKRCLILYVCISYMPLKAIFTECSDHRCSSFGAYSYYGNNLTVINFGEPYTFSVGKFCSMGSRITLYLGGNHRTEWISTFPFMSFNESFPEAAYIQGHPTAKGNIVIGNDVWIGDNVTIMSGVTIGDGAVIGAYAVVAKNVPPYAIFAGNPARLIRYRFDAETIQSLLELRWWDWPIERIRENVQLLCSDRIEDFIALFE